MSKVHGLVSMTSKSNLHLNYKTCIFQVQRETTDSGMAPKVIQMMHNKIQSAGASVTPATSLSSLP